MKRFKKNISVFYAQTIQNINVKLNIKTCILYIFTKNTFAKGPLKLVDWHSSLRSYIRNK